MDSYEENLIQAEDLDGADDTPGNEDGAQDVEVDTISGDKKDAKNKARKRASLPLNEKVLCSRKGLEELVRIFEGVEFSSGNEEKSLKKLLENFEYWAHQMYPRLSFEDVVEKVEALGAKRPVKQHAQAVKFGKLAEENEKDLEKIPGDLGSSVEEATLNNGRRSTKIDP